MTSPAGPGALVVRYQDIIGFLFTSEQSGLTVLTGLTLAQRDLLCSGGEVTFDRADVQLVFLPDGSSHELIKARDVTVLVFEGAFPEVDFCTSPPFAIGEGNFTYTDGGPFESRIARFQLGLEAQVKDLGGGSHHLLVRQVFHFDRMTQEVRELVNTLTLN